MTDLRVSLKLNIQNGDYLTIDKMIAHYTRTGFSGSGAPSSVAAVPMPWNLELTFYSTEGSPPPPLPTSNARLKAVQLVWLANAVNNEQDQSNFWKAVGFNHDHNPNRGRAWSFVSDNGVPPPVPMNQGNHANGGLVRRQTSVVSMVDPRYARPH